LRPGRPHLAIPHATPCPFLIGWGDANAISGPEVGLEPIFV
jgi:hypothetical protein